MKEYWAEKRYELISLDVDGGKNGFIRKFIDWRFFSNNLWVKTEEVVTCDI